MHKSILLDFISKYNISKIESVTWEVSENLLSTRFVSGNRSMIGEVIFKNFKAPDIKESKLGVYKTSALSKLLNVLENDINLNLVMVNDKPVAIQFNDGVVNAKYALSDLAIIPHVKKLTEIENLPSEYQVSIKIDSDFVSRFLRAKSSIPDTDSFSIHATDKKVSIIIGNMDGNNNTVTFDAEYSQTSKLDNKHFDSDVFAGIISANKGAEAELLISSVGISKIIFDTDEYKATYFLVARTS